MNGMNNHENDNISLADSSRYSMNDLWNMLQTYSDDDADSFADGGHPHATCTSNNSRRKGDRISRRRRSSDDVSTISHSIGGPDYIHSATRRGRAGHSSSLPNTCNNDIVLRETGISLSLSSPASQSVSAVGNSPLHSHSHLRSSSNENTTMLWDEEEQNSIVSAMKRKIVKDQRKLLSTRTRETEQQQQQQQQRRHEAQIRSLELQLENQNDDMDDMRRELANLRRNYDQQANDHAVVVRSNSVEVTELKSQCQELNVKSERLDRNLLTERQRSGTLQSSNHALAQQLSEAKIKIDAISSERDCAIKQHAALELDLQAQITRLEAHAVQLATARRERERELEDALSSSKEQKRKAEIESQSIISHLEGMIEQHSGDIDQIKSERDDLLAQIQSMGVDYEILQHANDDKQKCLYESMSEQERQQDAIEDLKGNLVDVTQQCDLQRRQLEERNVNAEAEIQHLQISLELCKKESSKEISLLSDLLAAKEVETTSMMSELDVANSNRTEITQKLQDQETVLEDLRGALKQCNHVKDQLKEKMLTSEFEKDGISSGKTSLELELSNLREKHCVLAKANDELRAKLDEVQVKLHGVLKEKIILSDRAAKDLSSEGWKNQSLLQKSEKLKDDILMLQQRLQKVEDEKRNAEIEIEDIEQEFWKYKGEAQTQLSSLESSILEKDEETKTIVAELTRELEKVDLERSEYAEKLQQCSARRDECSVKEIENLEEVKKLRIESQAKSKESELLMSSLKADNDSLVANITESQLEISRLQKLLAESEAQNGESERVIKGLKTDNNALKVNATESQSSFEKLQRSTAERVEALEQTKAVDEATIYSLQSQLTEIIARADEAVKELQTWQLKEISLLEKLSKIEIEHVASQSALKKSQNDNDKLVERLRSAEHQYYISTETATTKIRELESSIARKEEEVMSTSSKLSTTIDTLSLEQSSCAEKLNEEHQKNQRLEELYAGSKNKITELESSISERDMELFAFEESLKITKHEKDELVTSLNDALRDLNVSKTSLEERISFLESHLSEKDAETNEIVSELTAELEHSSDQISDLHEELLDKKRNMEEILLNEANAVAKFERLQSRFNEIKDHYDQIFATEQAKYHLLEQKSANQISEFELQIKSLLVKLASKEEQIITLQSSLKDNYSCLEIAGKASNAEKKSLLDAVSHAEAESNTLRNKLEEAQKSYKTLKMSTDELTKELDEKIATSLAREEEFQSIIDEGGKEARDEIGALSKTIEELTSKNKGLASELHGESLKCTCLETELEEKKNDLDELDSLAFDKNIEVVALEESLRVAKGENMQFQEKIDLAARQFNDMENLWQDRVSTLQEEMFSTEVLLEKANLERFTALSRESSAGDKIDELELRISRLQLAATDRIDAHACRVEQLERIIQFKNDENFRLQSDLHDQSRFADEVTSTLDGDRSEWKALNNSVAGCMEEISQLEDDLAASYKENKELRQSIEEQRLEFNKKRALFETQLASLEVEMSSKETEMKEIVTELTSELERVNSKRLQLEETKKTVDEFLKAERAKSNSIMQDFLLMQVQLEQFEETDDNEAEIAKLSLQVKEYSVKIMDISIEHKRSLEEKQKEVEEATAWYEEAEDQRAELSHLLDEERKRMHDIEIKVASLNSDNIDLRSQLRSEQRQAEEAEETARVARKKVEDAGLELIEVQRSHDKLQSVLHELQQSIASNNESSSKDVLGVISAREIQVERLESKLAQVVKEDYFQIQTESCTGIDLSQNTTSSQKDRCTLGEELVVARAKIHDLEGILKQNKNESKAIVDKLMQDLHGAESDRDALSRQLELVEIKRKDSIPDANESFTEISIIEHVTLEESLARETEMRHSNNKELDRMRMNLLDTQVKRGQHQKEADQLHATQRMNHAQKVKSLEIEIIRLSELLSQKEKAATAEERQCINVADENQVQSYEERITNLQLTIDDRNKVIHELAANINKLRTDCSVELRRAADGEENLVYANTEKELLEKQLESYEETINSLEEVIQEKDQEMEEVVSELTGEMEMLRNQNFEVQKKLASEECRIVDVEAENSLLLNQLQSCEQTIANLQKSTGERTLAGRDLLAELESLRNECVEYKGQLAEESCRLNDSEASVVALSKEKDFVKSKLRDRDVSLTKLQVVVDEGRKVISELTSELESLRSDYVGCTDKLSEEARKVTTMEESSVSLRFENDRLENHLHNCEATISTFHFTVTEKEKEVDTIVSELSSEIEILRGNCAVCNNDLEKEKHKLFESNKALVEMQDEIKFLKNELTTRDVSISNLQYTLEESKIIASDLTSELESVRSDCSEYQYMLTEAVRKSTEFERSLSFARDEKEQLQSCVDEGKVVVSDLTSEVELLRSDASDYYAKLAEATSRLTDSEEALATVRNENDILGKEVLNRDERILNLEIVIKDGEATACDVLSELGSWRSACSDCETKLTEATSRLTDIEDEKGVLKKEMLTRDNQIFNLQASIEDIKMTITDLTSELESVHTALKSEKEAASKRMSENESLRCDCTKLSKKLAEVICNLRNSDAMVITIREEKKYLQSEVEDHDRNLAMLQCVIEEGKREASRLVAELETLRLACTECHNRLTSEEGRSTDNETQLVTLCAVKHDLEDQLQNCKETVLVLERSSEKMNDAMRDLSCEVENLRKVCADESSNSANLEEELLLMRSEKDSIEIQLQSNERIIANFQNMVAEKEKEVDGIVLELTLEIEMLRSDCSEYCEKLKDALSQLGVCEKDLASTRSNKIGLENQMADNYQVTSKLQASVQENKAFASELALKLELLQGDNQKLVAESSSRVAEIEVQLESSKAENTLLSSQLQRLKETVSSPSMLKENEGTFKHVSIEFKKKLANEAIRADEHETVADELKDKVSSLESHLKTYPEGKQQRRQHTQQRPVMVTNVSQTTPDMEQYEVRLCDLELTDLEISQQKEYQRIHQAVGAGDADDSQHQAGKTKGDQAITISALEQQLSEQGNLVEHLNAELNEKMDELEECYIQLDELISGKEEQQNNSEERIGELRKSLDEVLSANKEMEDRLGQMILPNQQNEGKEEIVVKGNDPPSPNLISEVLNLANCLLELQNAENKRDAVVIEDDVVDDVNGYTLGCNDTDRNLEQRLVAEDKVRGALSQIFYKLKHFDAHCNAIDNCDDVDSSYRELFQTSPEKHDAGVQCSHVETPEGKDTCHNTLMSPTTAASGGSFMGEINHIVSQGEAEIQSVINIFEREITMEPWKRRKYLDDDDSSFCSNLSFDTNSGCHQCKQLKHEYQEILGETLRLIEGSRSVNEAAIRAAKAEVRRQAAYDLEESRMRIYDKFVHAQKQESVACGKKAFAKNAPLDSHSYGHRRVRSAEL